MTESNRVSCMATRWYQINGLFSVHERTAVAGFCCVFKLLWSQGQALAKWLWDEIYGHTRVKRTPLLHF